MHSRSGSSRPAPPDRQEVLAHIGLGALVADVARMLQHHRGLESLSLRGAGSCTCSAPTGQMSAGGRCRSAS
jgi:hypothetical protein